MWHLEMPENHTFLSDIRATFCYNDGYMAMRISMAVGVSHRDDPAAILD